jgi:hypothetical protein
MEAIALISICALCVVVGFYFLEKAFKTARFYPGQPLEAKRIIVKKVNGHIITTTTRGGEQ